MGKDNTGIVYKFFGKILNVIGKEKNSTAGKVNLISDLILATIIIIYILSSTVTNVARIICSIFNADITKYTSDSSLIIMFLILIVFFIGCLIFISKCNFPNKKDIKVESSTKSN